MPFVAKDLTTGARIDITEVENPMVNLRQKDLSCPYCTSGMLVKAGQLRQAHFAHLSRCTSIYGETWHAESPAHLRGKSLAKAWMQHEQAFFGAEVLLEYPLPSLKRIADVVARWSDGSLFAIEIQLAGLTVETLAKRTEDYHACDIPVFWWLGKSALTPAIRHWCAMQALSMPEHGILVFDDEQPSMPCSIAKPFSVQRFRQQYATTPFATCPQCAATVMVRVYNAQEGWKRLPEPGSPVFGSPHSCQPMA